MNAPNPTGGFTQVHTNVVEALEGDAVAGLVFERIVWRSDFADGTWAASYATIAEETGLTTKRVRRATEVLREKGWLEAERDSHTDRTLRWTPIFERSTPAPEGTTKCPTGQNVEPQRALGSAPQGSTSYKTTKTPPGETTTDAAVAPVQDQKEATAPVPVDRRRTNRFAAYCPRCGAKAQPGQAVEGDELGTDGKPQWFHHDCHPDHWTEPVAEQQQVVEVVAGAGLAMLRAHIAQGQG